MTTSLRVPHQVLTTKAAVAPFSPHALPSHGPSSLATQRPIPAVLKLRNRPELFTGFLRATLPGEDNAEVIYGQAVPQSR